MMHASAPAFFWLWASLAVSYCLGRYRVRKNPVSKFRRMQDPKSDQINPAELLESISVMMNKRRAFS